MAKSTPKTIGERIRQIRGDSTQMVFAEFLGIRQAMVSRYEANKEIPTPRIMLRIAKHSGKSMEWLLTGKDNLWSPSSKDELRLLMESPRGMTEKELINAAAAYIVCMGTPESREFGSLIRDLFKDKGKMKKVLSYYRYVRDQESSDSQAV